MKKEELIKGRWYLTAGEMFIRFDYLTGRQVWVSEYYNSVKRHTVESGFTEYEIIREATSADALAYPRILETYDAIGNNGDSPITNYEIY
jgi:hypothetical protein